MTLLLALLLTPLIFYGLYQYYISDIGSASFDDVFPRPWLQFLMGTIFSYFLSVICASPIVSVYRVVARLWKNKPTIHKF